MRVPDKVKGFYFQKTIPVSDKAPVLGYRSIRQRLCGNFQGIFNFLKNSICTFLINAIVQKSSKKRFWVVQSTISDVFLSVKSKPVAKKSFFDVLYNFTYQKCEIRIFLKIKNFHIPSIGALYNTRKVFWRK